MRASPPGPTQCGAAGRQTSDATQRLKGDPQARRGARAATNANPLASRCSNSALLLSAHTGFCSISCRAIMMRCISFVPSPMHMSGAARQSRSIEYSFE